MTGPDPVGGREAEREAARATVEHALRAIDAGQYGEAWLALKDAMRKLEEAEDG